MKHKGTIFGGNNRKCTRGRTVSVASFNESKTVGKDMGFTKHEAVKHLLSTCPQTGAKMYAKQGKAKEIDFVVTLPEGSKLKTKWGMKTWIEQEATNGKAGGWR